VSRDDAHMRAPAAKHARRQLRQHGMRDGHAHIQTGCVPPHRQQPRIRMPLINTDQQSTAQQGSRLPPAEGNGRARQAPTSRSLAAATTAPATIHSAAKLRSDGA
jgi:hypothetical protein